ncbi:MAG: hypothetical protein EXR73_03040 [Myxococcales bacterium]|nr:hypothetical protein [Myxococcales bacterium]
MRLTILSSISANAGVASAGSGVVTGLLFDNNFEMLFYKLMASHLLLIPAQPCVAGGQPGAALFRPFN